MASARLLGLSARPVISGERVPLVEGKLIGKYRLFLVPFSELPPEAARLHPHLERLSAANASGQLGDADYAAGFIAVFSAARAEYYRQKSGRRRATALQNPAISSILERWRKGSVDLRLTHTAVSPDEMLRAQAEGWRYVTMDIAAALAGEPVEGNRDAFEFALHDLGHAYTFFKPEYDPPGQVEFFAALLADLPILAGYATADAKFATALEYCMADMNTHPQHLRQYLRGVIVEMFLRRNAPEYETELRSLVAKLSCLEKLQPSPERTC